MRTLLNKWQPKRVLGKTLRFAFWLIAILMGLSFLILPFLKFSGNLLLIAKYLWIVCAVLNLDKFGEYRNSRKAKIITPTFTVYTFLLLMYLHNYWQILSLPVVISIGIVVGLLEFTISVATYKTIRFNDKNPYKQLSNKTIHLWVSGCLYACSVTLFVCGLLTSIAMMFVSGVIAMIFLVVSVLSSISNGLFENKSILKVFWFVIDCVSLIALTIFLIYRIPNTFENLQTIVTTIVAAIFGGVLTLAGVAWTINAQLRKERRQTQMQFMPYLKAVSKVVNKIIKACYCSEVEDANYVVCVESVSIKNISNNIVIIESVSVDEIVEYCVEDNILEKDEVFALKLDDLYRDKLVSQININCVDVLGNKYSLKCLYNCQLEKIYGNKEIAKYTIEYINMPKLEK